MPKVGLLYDPIFMEHNTGSHPENALRLKYIRDTLDDYGILSQMVQIQPADATMEQLSRFHQPHYIQHVADMSSRGGGRLDADTVMSAKSYEAAVRAAGAAVTAVDNVIAGAVDSAFALVRPPGHHALAGKGMGFCLFNNVVVAAMHARDVHGLERIMIIDWDVHHGNGTEEAFIGDPGVIYFSTHQQGNFPGTGAISETGRGKGEGFTINVPLAAHTGDAGFYYVFTQLLEPVARQYKPQLIMISAGFDAHYADPLGGLQLTCKGYSQMAEIVRNLAVELCGGKIVMALEGGYSLGAIGHAAAAVVNVLGEYGAKVEDPAGAPMTYTKPTMRVSIDEVIRVQKKYWNL